MHKRAININKLEMQSEEVGLPGDMLCLFKRSCIRILVHEEARNGPGVENFLEFNGNIGLISGTMRKLIADCPLIPVQEDSFRQTAHELYQRLVLKYNTEDTDEVRKFSTDVIAAENDRCYSQVQNFLAKASCRFLYAFFGANPSAAELSLKGLLPKTNEPVESLKLLFADCNTHHSLPSEFRESMDILTTALADEFEEELYWSERNYNLIHRLHKLTPFAAVAALARLGNPTTIMSSTVSLFLATPFGTQSMLQRLVRSALSNSESGPEGDGYDALIRYLGTDEFKKSVKLLVQRVLEPLSLFLGAVPMHKLIKRTAKGLGKALRQTELLKRHGAQRHEIQATYKYLADSTIGAVWDLTRAIVLNEGAEDSPLLHALNWMLLRWCDVAGRDEASSAVDNVIRTELSSQDEHTREAVTKWLQAELELCQARSEKRVQKQQLKMLVAEAIQQDGGESLAASEALAKLDCVREELRNLTHTSHISTNIDIWLLPKVKDSLISWLSIR